MFKRFKKPEKALKENPISIEDVPICNHEQAKKYYLAMGCSHFHLSRENFKRRDEYYAMNISSTLEEKWRLDEIRKRFEEFPYDNPEIIGLYYSSLKDILIYTKDQLTLMLNVLINIVDIIPPDDIYIILNTVVGNNSSAMHGGLIEEACKLGENQLAIQFIEYVKILISKVEKHNISLTFIRGYLVDVIMNSEIEIDNEFIQSLKEKDNFESFTYYQKGAMEENIFSMRMLAQCYNLGKGCDKNLDQATYWLIQAAKLGNNLAAKELLELQRNMK